MTLPARRPFLRLVLNRGTDLRDKGVDAHFEPIQSPLIALSQKTLFVCTTEGFDESSFLHLIDQAKPSSLLDLRSAPRFDFGPLNRRSVLSFFENHHIQYFDVANEATTDEGFAGALRPFTEKPAFKEAVENESASIVVFVDPRPDYRDIAFRLVRCIREFSQCDWELVLHGPILERSDERSLLFISHANPEDNEFVLWLQAQLTKHGYAVWSDLTNLSAGENVWTTIEDVIRRQAAKVLVVASRAAVSKPGVLDEISLAVSIERTEKLSGFVIPLRVDLAFSEFPVNIARKNAIDYSKGWSKGLIQLVDTLKRADTPRTGGFDGSELEAWWESRKIARSRIEPGTELLVSNEFEVRLLPERLFLLHGTPTNTFSNDRNRGPLIPFQDRWLSFLSDSELSAAGTAGLSLDTTALLSEVGAGNISFVRHLHAGDRQKLIRRLLNRHWEWFLEHKGLLRYEASQRPAVMYFPLGLVEKDQMEFIDVDGRPTRRKLVGYSQKRRLFWHLGITGRFGGDARQFMRVKLSIIFTQDGAGQVITSQKELRRRFCKNWWNDRWRCLQGAAMKWLESKSSEVVVHSGSGGTFAISSVGTTFCSPVRIREEKAEMLDTVTLDSDKLLDELETVDESELMDEFSETEMDSQYGIRE